MGKGQRRETGCCSSAHLGLQRHASSFHPRKRNISADTRKSVQVCFLGFDWPNHKAYRVLTSRGTVETPRHLAFDESAPPACETRDDFSPCIETTVGTNEPSSSAESPVESPQAVPSGVPDATEQQPLLTLSPIDDSGAESSNTVPEAPAPPMNINPLFDDTLITPPSLLTDPRRSERDNKGKHAPRFDPCAYSKFAKGIPSRVHFADPIQSFLLYVGYLQSPQQ